MQKEIIESVLEGQDTFALLPTGGGKSICFQVPAMMQEGICLVISPLVALMKDQVANLQKRDIKAIALTGGIHTEEIIDLLRQLPIRKLQIPLSFARTFTIGLDFGTHQKSSHQFNCY